MTTLNDAFKYEHAQEDEGYESGSKSLNIPSSLRRALWIYHISTSENLSFEPTTLLTKAEQHPVHSIQRLRSHNPVCHHLVFSSSDEESPVRTGTSGSSPLHDRAEPSSPAQYYINYHHTSTPSIDDSFQDATVEEEDFPKAPLDDDIWLEDPVPDRCLCIHEQSHSYNSNAWILLF